MPRVEVKLGTQVLEGWNSIQVDHSLGAACGRARISATSAVAPLLAQNEILEVAWGGEPVFRGWIDTVEAEWSGGDASVQASARSLTADLVDSSLDPLSAPTELRDQNIEGIARSLAGTILRAGITQHLRADLDTIPVFTAQSGETYWEAIERACRQFGLLATSGRRGELRLIDPTLFPRRPVALRERENVISARFSADWRDRFWSYIAEGETDPEGDDWSDRLRSAVEATDDAVRRSRVHVFSVEGVATEELCRRRAQWEAAVRAARATRVTVKVPGWAPSESESAWEPGHRVAVALPAIRVSGELLIDGVTLSIDEEGLVSSLSLARRDAYLSSPRLPENEEPAGRWAS